MAWIEVVPPDQAGDELRAAYEEIRERRGKLSNIMAIQSLNPKMIGPHLELYMAIMFERSGLSDAEILNLAAVISYFNFVNRIAVGLGVEVTDEEVAGYKY